MTDAFDDYEEDEEDLGIADVFLTSLQEQEPEQPPDEPDEPEPPQTPDSAPSLLEPQAVAPDEEVEIPLSPNATLFRGTPQEPDEIIQLRSEPESGLQSEDGMDSRVSALETQLDQFLTEIDRRDQAFAAGDALARP